MAIRWPMSQSLCCNRPLSVRVALAHIRTEGGLDCELLCISLQLPNALCPPKSGPLFEDCVCPIMKARNLLTASARLWKPFSLFPDHLNQQLLWSSVASEDGLHEVAPWFHEAESLPSHLMSALFVAPETTFCMPAWLRLAARLLPNSCMFICLLSRVPNWIARFTRTCSRQPPQFAFLPPFWKRVL